MPKRKKRKPISESLAIVCLILNILILPGLGSVIGRKHKQGIWQIILAVVGAPLMIFIIGIPMILAAWIWGIVTGIQLIEDAPKRKL